MNVGEIINLTRSTVLDDTIEPFLWGNDEIIHYLNIITEELYRETLLVEDRSTVSLTQYKLLSNMGLYTTDDLVLNIKEGAYLLHHHPGHPRTLIRTSEAYMDQWHRNWREEHHHEGEWHGPRRYIPECGKGYFYIYPKYHRKGEVVGVSSISFTAATSQISITGVDEDGNPWNFTTHYDVGDEINISGTVKNNGYVTVASLTASEITVNQALSDEFLTSATLRKVCNTLITVVNRLPLAPFTTADITANPPVAPEIKAMYHRELIYGIGREAFLKEDTQTLDPASSDKNGKRFEILKAKVKKDLIFLDRSERQVRSGRSGIWKSY
jgi:hypothetical protein